MKLSWLNTSEAHANNTSIYMIWQYDAMLKAIERVRVNGSNTNIEICFEVRAHSSTFSPSHRRISTNWSTQDSHTGNLHWGFGAIQQGLHNFSLNRIQPLTKGNAQLTQIPPHTRGVGTSPLQINHLTLEGFQHKLHLSLEGANQQSPPLTRGSQPPLQNQPLHKRDITNKEGYNLVVYLNHKQLLS